MRLLMNSKWLLFFLLIATCVLITNARRGGGGSRGGGSRGSSRGSSSSSSRTSSSRGSTIDRSRDRSPPAPPPRPPAPAPRPPPPPPPPKRPPAPSAPEVRQPAYNPNYRESNPSVNQQPPPYSPRERPPPYSPSGTNQGAPPPYSPGSPARPPTFGEAPPPYSPSGGLPGASYPRQPGMPGANYPQQSGIPGASYPRQPGMPGANYPQQGGIPGASYPRQPGMPGSNYPQPGGVSGANYPRQPGTFQQPGGIPGANYPRQTYTSYPANSLGSNVWSPQSGRPAPAYMNYGGLPTGANMYTKPEKKKGFIGSLMSMGSHKNKENKYFGSQPSPYAAGGMGGMGGGFMGKHGSKAAMYTILPYMAAKKTPKLFRPRFGYMPMFLPSPFHHHHYHYGHYGHSHYYDIYNNDYAGRCNRPIAPKNGKIVCNATRGEVDCDVTCDEGYLHPDNTTSKTSKCWHVTGVWKPMKNFPDCQPVCNKTCFNGGTCIGPNVCGCPPEYRGLQCEFYFLNCDIRKLANGIQIRWVCTHSKNGTSCKVKCKTPLEFEAPTEEVYKCSPDGVWTPSKIPQCVSPDMVTTETSTQKPSEEATTGTPEEKTTGTPEEKTTGTSEETTTGTSEATTQEA